MAHVQSPRRGAAYSSTAPLVPRRAFGALLTLHARADVAPDGEPAAGKGEKIHSGRVGACLWATNQVRADGAFDVVVGKGLVDAATAAGEVITLQEIRNCQKLQASLNLLKLFPPGACATAKAASYPKVSYEPS